MSEALDEVVRGFRALSPASALVAGVRELPDWPSLATQKTVRDRVLCDPLCSLFPPDAASTRAFLKAFVAAVEAAGAEVDEQILSLHLDLISAAAPSSSSSLSHCVLCRAEEPLSSDLSAAVVLRVAARQLSPVGLAAWPAGLLLADLAASRPQLFAGRSVLELGAGVGIAGLAAAKWANPRRVVLTDLPQIVPNLEHNAALNALANVSVSALDWEDDEDVGGVEDFDVAIAADCVYGPELAVALARVLGKLLRSSRTAIVANTVREPSTIETLKEALTETGLEWSELQPPETVPRIFGSKFALPRPAQSVLWTVKAR